MCTYVCVYVCVGASVSVSECERAPRSAAAVLALRAVASPTWPNLIAEQTDTHAHAHARAH